MKIIILLFIGLFSLGISNLSKAESNADELTQVTLQLMWKHQFEFAGFYAAIEQGYYQEYGLDVKIREYEQEMDLVDEVTSARANYGISDASLIVDRANGAPVVLLANIFQHSPIVLLSLATNKIYSPAQMIGKSMMLSKHEIANASIIAMLNTESVSLEQIKVSEHTFNLDDFINGKVDIISAYATNQPGVLKERQVQFNIIDPINYGIDFYGDNIFTSELELKQHPKRVANFIEASLRGWRYALDHPDEIIDLILNKYSKQKSRAALVFEAKKLERFILPEYIEIGAINLDRMNRILDVYKQLKKVPKAFVLEGFIYQVSAATNSSLILSREEENWIQQHPQIEMGVDPAWAPFEFINEQDEYSGMAADYIDLIAEITGLDFVVQNHPNWQSVMQSARRGQIDLLPAVMPSKQRRDFLDFTESYINYPMVIVTSKDSPFLSSFKDLENKQVVVVKGYVTDDILRTNHPEISLKSAINLQDALKMVSSGNADALVGNLGAVSFTLSQFGISNLRISGTTPYEFSLAFAVPKKNKTLLSIIQKALKHISEEQKRKIRDKWISVQYSQAPFYKKIIQITSALVIFILIILFWNRKLAREVKARKVVEDALRFRENQFRNLVENTSIVAWEVDLKTFQFTYVSPHAEVMLGYPVDDWYQKNFWVDHIVATDREPSSTFCMGKVKQGLDHTFEYRMTKADGDIIWIRDIVTVNKDIKGISLFLSGVLIDISEGKKYEIALEKAKLDAEQANNIKSEFIATMSHELRTPLNGVLGITQILQESQLNQEQQKHVNILMRSGTALLGIINDVLDLSKLEAEQVKLESHNFNLVRLIREALDLFISDSRNKNLNLILDYPADLQRNFMGDPLRFRQILINLLGNAVKFTDKGGVRIEVTGQSLSEHKTELTICVIDTGIGIDSAKLADLFVPFVQADQSTTRKFGGTGLGLSICKKLIQLMHGEIGVESESGKGTTFWIKISLLNSEVGLIIENEYTIPSISRIKFNGKVLVADDDDTNQLIAGNMLRKMGLEVDFADNGIQAIELWKNNSYDLIFMDCRMPIMDGYDTTQLIRQKETQNVMPIVALTANNSIEDTTRCIESGMNEVIIKPFTREHLIRSLKCWISPSKQYVTEFNPIETVDSRDLMEKPKQENSLDVSILEKLSFEMGEDFLAVRAAILQSIEEIVTQLEEKSALMPAKDFAGLVHNLKSPSANLGAVKLNKMAAKIEALADKNYLKQASALLPQLKQEYKQVLVELARVET